MEVRVIYREQGRALEDVQFGTLEAIQNYYYGTNYGYPVDPFPGFGAEPFGSYVLANPGDNTPSILPKAVREYTAGEFIMNKRFSNGWLLYGNFRLSKLTGNYEGLFRNDNGQSDPNITSLFDFPNSTLMRGQFQSGRLNNDRPYSLNLAGSYSWETGFTLGGRFNWQSGVPRTPLLAHPNYQNAGEIPGTDPVYFWYTSTGYSLADPNCGVILDPDDPNPNDPAQQYCFATGTGNDFANDPGVHGLTPILYTYTDSPRGSLGRTPDIATFDVHANYPIKIGKTDLELSATVFNLFNQQAITYQNDQVEATAGLGDPDFNRPLNLPAAQRAYQEPRSVRFMARWNF